MRWIERPRKDIIEFHKRMLFKAALDVFGKDDDEMVDKLKGRGFRAGVSNQAIQIARHRWEGEKTLSRWQVVSGLTQAAQSLGMDARYEVERQAGVLLGA